MCHFLPVYYLGIVFLGRVEGQNITRDPTVHRWLRSPIYEIVGVSPIDGLVLMWHIPTELSSVQSRFSLTLSESLPRAVIFLIVKLRRGLSLLSFVCVLFAFNIFLITYFCVVSSFEPHLDHNRNKTWIFLKNISDILQNCHRTVTYPPPYLINSPNKTNKTCWV